MKTHVRESLTRNFVLPGLLALLIPVGAFAQSSDQQPSTSDLQKQLQEMRSLVEKMQSRIDELEKDKLNRGTNPVAQTSPKPDLPQAPASAHVGEATANYQAFSEDPVAAARYNNVPLDPKYHGYFILPGTQTLLKIGGFFKTDFSFDQKQAGDPDQFIPSSIPIPAVSGVRNSNVMVRATRLNFDFRIPNSRAGDARFFIEGDFFGTNATTPRLRHAYAQVRNFLLGQTFSNFMDPDVTPDTLDVRGPTGWVNLRNPQLRYGFALNKRAVLFASVEKPTSDLEVKTPQFTSQPNSPSPDFTLRLRQEFQRGHWQVASVFRSIAGFLPDGRTGSVFGWGVNGSGAIRLLRKDNLLVQGAYGRGISRYIQDASGLGIDAAVISAADPHLRATPAVGIMAAFQHYWTSSLRSNVIYGQTQVTNTAFQTKSTYHKSQYGSVNLIWNPFGSLEVGAQYHYGWKDLKDGEKGNASRFQISAKYSFVKVDRDKKMVASANSENPTKAKE
jgi:hypothetical protein